MSKTRVERTISKSKTLFRLLLVEPNTTNGVTLFHPFIQSPLKFWDETFYGMKPLDDQCLTLEYKPTLSFNMSFDEYIKILNKLMSVKPYVFNCFDKKALNSFKNSYMFKRGGALSTLAIFKPKGTVKYLRLMFMDFNIKDLRENPS